MIDLTPIINAIILLLGALAVRYLVPWLKANTTAEERKDLFFWADIAVQAAQQLYYQQDGASRKEYAQFIMMQHGFDISEPEVDAAIEAAVLALHQALESE